MALTLDQAKIRAIGYDYKSIQDNSIVDGDTFSGTNPFLLIANKPIPLNAKVYMEIEITSNHSNKDIRHIPIYLGVHKEPSFGVLGSDCCLGSVYYTKNSYMLGPDDISYLAFCLREKFNHQEMIYTYVNNTGGRVPLKGTVIGLGVDMMKNTITIFSDGAEFYSFSPEKFDLNNGEDYYLSVYASEYGETVSGRINYGRYETKYHPDGYINFYQELFAKQSEHYDIESHVTVGQRYSNPAINPNIVFGSMSMINDIAPVPENTHRRDIELICNHPDEMIQYKDFEKTVINKHGFSFKLNKNKLEDPDMAYINYPLDHTKKLYFEFHCSNASLNDEQMGVPLTIGLTQDPNDLSKKSFQIDLFHLRTDGYHLLTVKDGYEFLAGNYTILSPSAPIQPDDIGIVIDLSQNTVEIYTDGNLFTIVKPNEALVDFKDTTEITYFFFKTRPDKSHGEGYVICNFGTKDSASAGIGTPIIDETPYLDDDFEFDICDNMAVLSLWYYYNYTIKTLLTKDIACTIKVISDRIPFSKFIYCSVTVPDDYTEWGPGLNTLYGTYNKVSDEEEKQNLPDKSAFDIKKMIEEDKESNKR